MEGRVHAELVGLSVSMVDVGEELNVSLDMWTENRGALVTNKVCNNVKRRKQENKEYIKMRRVCGENDQRTERANIYYFKKK